MKQNLTVGVVVISAMVLINGAFASCRTNNRHGYCPGQATPQVPTSPCRHSNRHGRCFLNGFDSQISEALTKTSSDLDTDEAFIANQGSLLNGDYYVTTNDCSNYLNTNDIVSIKVNKNGVSLGKLVFDAPGSKDGRARQNLGTYLVGEGSVQYLGDSMFKEVGILTNSGTSYIYSTMVSEQIGAFSNTKIEFIIVKTSEGVTLMTNDSVNFNSCSLTAIPQY